MTPKSYRELQTSQTDQRYIREQMAEEGYIAFIANGSVLPRENGVSQRPMKKGGAICLAGIHGGYVEPSA